MKLIVPNQQVDLGLVIALVWDVSKLNPIPQQGNAPAGIRTRVTASKGQYDWPDYTTGAMYWFCELEQSETHAVQQKFTLNFCAQLNIIQFVRMDATTPVITLQEQCKEKCFECL